MKLNRCDKCGGHARYAGSDWRNDEGPWQVVCMKCGHESDAWAYKDEALYQWNLSNPKGATAAMIRSRDRYSEYLNVSDVYDISFHKFLTDPYFKNTRGE